MLTLAVNETRRLIRHPLNLLGLALWCIAVAGDAWTGPRPAFSALTTPMTMFWGVPLFFAANLVASSAQRSRAEEMLAARPLSRTGRIRALALAGCALFAMGAAAQAVLALLYLLTGNEMQRFPNLAELAFGPLNLLGAGLLGVAVARWAPWPGAAAVAMVALVTANLVWSGDGDGALDLLTFQTDFAIWGPLPSKAAMGFRAGSSLWHAVYLLALCVGAGALALLADAPRRWPWLALGGAAIVAVVLAGMWQFP